MFLMRKAFHHLRLPYSNTNKTANDMAEESTTPNFIPLPPDVLYLKSVLWQKGLPVELIDSVIDFAEYWPRLATEVENTITVENNGRMVYLQSQPLPGLFASESSGEGGTSEELVVGGLEESKRNPVRKLVFRTWSKDQGWSSRPGQGVVSSSSSSYIPISRN